MFRDGGNLFGLRVGMTEDANCVPSGKPKSYFEREESSVRRGGKTLQNTNFSQMGTNPQITFYQASPKAANVAQFAVLNPDCVCIFALL